MGTFGMQTSDMHTGGVNIQNQADEFGYAHKKLNETVDFLMKVYPSSDGIALGESVKGYDATLNAMEAKLRAHGDFGVYASKRTVAANEDITSKIAKNI